MTTSDHFSTIASLESALAQEKACHTDTLVKLRLTEEALKASEAERSRWRSLAEMGDRIRESDEAVFVFLRAYGDMLSDLLSEYVSNGVELATELDQLLLTLELEDDAATIPNNERPEQ